MATALQALDVDVQLMILAAVWRAGRSTRSYMLTITVECNITEVIAQCCVELQIILPLVKKPDLPRSSLHLQQ